ncbi:uncharacterized protein LOC133733269 [Rosa rugosa]|uniref:uncharacterized protein LOC133733269 n=1 Tax=Rosa rugosa TaxID=74645 RepID=UPI002B401603|nr:uncharacterized protein LOC133733269 [Rosa rugosa]
MANSIGRKLRMVFIRKMFRNLFKKNKNYSKDLPEEIMQLILQRLCIIDYLRCREVSRSWRAAVDRAIVVKLCPPVPQPWLLLNSLRPFYIRDGCSLASLSKQETHKSKSSRLYDGRVHCVGSIDGWLIMAKVPEDSLSSDCNCVNFFLNPLSGARVMLPSQSTISHYENNLPNFFRKVVASSIPTMQHCIVVSLCLDKKLYLCRHIDKSWTLIETSYCDDIEIVDDKLYAATKTGSELILMVFSFSIQEVHDGGPLTYKAERFCFRPSNLVDNVRIVGGVTYWTLYTDLYLAKGSASEEVFVILTEVVSVYNALRPIPYSTGTEGFRVLKLDCNTNGYPWVEVFDLGDQILFLSRCSSKFIASSGGFRRSLHNETLERDSIYFAFRNEFGVFSLPNRNIKCLTFRRNHSVDFVRESVWFTPNPW